MKNIVKKIIIALLIPTLMIAILYFMDIFNLSTESEVKLFKYANLVELAVLNHDRKLPDDVLFVNISYDKTLIPVYDEHGFRQGTIDITDRDKLYRFLKSAEKSDNYKYILLDVFFEKGLESHCDSLLFHQIASMSRICIPKHTDRELADSLLLPKAAYAEYRTDIEESGFVKYPLFIKQEPTLATAMYEECSGHKIKVRALYAKDGNKLMQKSILPILEVSGFGKYGSNGKKNILNLSEDILALEEYGLLETMLDNKYIVIGSFYDNDIHDTFRGELPGCIINFNIFLSLKNGYHIIEFSHFFFLWFIFFLMGLNCISGKAFIKTGNKLLSIVLSWLNFSIILSIICIIYYFCFNKAFDILIIASVFELLKRVINFKGKECTN